MKFLHAGGSGLEESEFGFDCKGGLGLVSIISLVALTKTKYKTVE